MKKRAGNSTDRDAELAVLCERYVNEDVTITTRGLARELGIQASSISRDAGRSAVVEAAKERQASMRQWTQRQVKQDRLADAAQLAARDEKIRELEASNALLTASHVAAIRAVGEMGGVRAWRKFFGEYQNLPGGASVVDLSERRKG